MDFGNSGSLREGRWPQLGDMIHLDVPVDALTIRFADGIHLDMDRLKKGEVKYVYSVPAFLHA
jgi:hypothetical protein